MSTRSFSVAVLFLLVSTGWAYSTSDQAYISGETKDCFAGKQIVVPGAEVYLINPEESPEVPKILARMGQELAQGEKALQEFWKSHADLVRAVRHESIARTTTNRTGRFLFSRLRTGQRLIVIGLAEREDDSAFQAHARVNSLRAGQNSIVLDFYSGHACDGTTARDMGKAEGLGEHGRTWGQTERNPSHWFLKPE